MKYFVGPYQPFYNDDLPPVQIGWKPPDGTLGSIDLRPLAEQASLTAGDGVGLFAQPDISLLSADREYIEVPAELTPQQLRQVEKRLKLPSRTRPLELWALVLDLLSFDADPDGQVWCPPLMPSSRGRYHVRCSGEKSSGKWVLGDQRQANAITRFQHNYKELRLRDEQLARKWLGFQQRKLKLKGNEYEQLQPLQYRGETPLEPATTHTESFNGADNAVMGKDLTWTQATAWENASNGGRIKASGTSVTNRYASADADISGDDMQLDVTITGQSAATSSNQGGLLGRYVDSNDYYIWIFQDFTAYLAKYVSGTYTGIDTASVSVSFPKAVRLDIDGSSLTGWWDGSSVASGTDTSHSGQTRGGLFGQSTSSSRYVDHDDWSIADIGGGYTPPQGLNGNLSGYTHTIEDGFTI